MKQWSVFLIGIILSLSGYAQDRLFVLHQLVGDTIDKNEKMNYLLFPDINDSDFRYCTIIHSKDGYFVNSHTQNDSVVISQIDSTEISQYMVNLDKVMEYYSNEGKKDSLRSSKKGLPDLSGINPIRVNDKILGLDDKERILQEVRRNNRMKEDAERHSYVKKGNDIMGDGAHIEFSNTGRKKRK